MRSRINRTDSNIQAWFRGIATRNHLRKLHENATILQRHWRGYRTRILVNRCIVERVHQMWQDYYNSMATRIQSVWRGYWARKTRMNVLQLRQWRKDVCRKNDETLENMKKYVRVLIYSRSLLSRILSYIFYLDRFRQRELDHAENVTEQEAMHWILFILFKVKIKVNSSLKKFYSRNQGAIL